MKKLTLKKLKNNSHIDSKLIGSVVRQMGGWANFQDYAEDVYNNGAAGGYTGFIYYSDTVAFTKRNRSMIISMAEEQASELGYESAITMIADFNCLKGYSDIEVSEAIFNPRSEEKTQIYNALAWYALEEVCRAYMDLQEYHNI